MKTLKFLTLVILITVCSFASAQNHSKVVKELKHVLKKSLYQSEVIISEQLLLHRKDSNKNTFTLELKDVKEIKYENDGFHNLLIVMKKGKIAKAIVENVKTESELNVFAFKDRADCNKAINLFKMLVE